MDLPDTLQPSVGLVPAEAKLAATKRSASLFSSLLFIPPSGRNKEKRHFGELSVAKESWPRRHKAGGGQEGWPCRRSCSLPSGLSRRRRNLPLLSAPLCSSLLILPPSGRKNEKGHFGELSVSKESWPRRHKADGGQESGCNAGRHLRKLPRRAVLRCD